MAAGAWAKGLLPFLKPSLNIARQTVGYFTPEDDPEAYRPGRFPVWAYREQDENNLFSTECPNSGAQASRWAVT